MSYNAINTKSDGDPVSANDWNAIVGNFAAGVPDLMTTKGDIVAATGADAAARVGVGSNDSYLFADSGQDAGLVWSVPGRLSAYYTNGTNLDITENAWAKYPFTFTERYDTSGAFDTAEGTYTAPHAGYYLVTGLLRVYHIGASEQFTAMLGVYKNGVLDVNLGTKFRITFYNTNPCYETVSGSAIIYAEKGDTLEFYTYTAAASGSMQSNYADITISPII